MVRVLPETEYEDMQAKIREHKSRSEPAHHPDS